MKTQKMYNEEEYELDNRYNDEESRYTYNESSIWYNWRSLKARNLLPLNIIIAERQHFFYFSFFFSTIFSYLCRYERNEMAWKRHTGWCWLCWQSGVWPHCQLWTHDRPTHSTSRHGEMDRMHRTWRRNETCWQQWETSILSFFTSYFYSGNSSTSPSTDGQLYA